MLLWAGVASAANRRLAAAACSSPSPGDSVTMKCEAWCSASEKAFDCNFCMCKACSFCGGEVGPRLSSSSAPVPARVKVECPLGVSVELIKSWGEGSSNGGFRLEVVVQRWDPDTLVNFQWSGSPPTVSAAFAADVVAQTDGHVSFKLRNQWDENHGFGVIAKGIYSRPTITCEQLAHHSSAGHTQASSPSASMLSPFPPPPPDAPSPPPYPPLTEKQKNVAIEGACGVLNVNVDRQDGGVTSLTIGLEPWRPGIPIHVSLNKRGSHIRTSHCRSTFASSPLSPSQA